MLPSTTDVRLFCVWSACVFVKAASHDRGVNRSLRGFVFSDGNEGHFLAVPDEGAARRLVVLAKDALVTVFVFLGDRQGLWICASAHCANPIASVVRPHPEQSHAEPETARVSAPQP